MTSCRALIGESRRPPCPLLSVIIILGVANTSAISDKTRWEVPGVLLESPSFELDLISSVSRFFLVHQYMFCRPLTHRLLRLLSANSVGTVPVLPTSQLTPGQSSPSQLNIADAFPAPLRSDRLNSLFPTVVSSFAQVVSFLVRYIPLVNPLSNLYDHEKEFITPGGTVFGGRARLLVQYSMSYAAISESTVTWIPSSSASSNKEPGSAI